MFHRHSLGGANPFAPALIVVLLFVAGPAQARGGSTASGTSNKLNPAISLNALFLGELTDPREETDGLSAEELELIVTSVVDPHFKAFANVSFTPDRSGPESEVALEEGFVRVMGLPEGVGLRVGRFLLPMGRHNQLHTHQFPFITAPRAVEAVLGEESVGDVGVEASYSPLLPWYVNLRVYGSDGASDAFDRDGRDLVYGGRVENLWDLGEATTLEISASALSGSKASHRRILYGGDIRLKWKNIRKTYGRAFTWVTEFLGDHIPGHPEESGVYTLALYRFARRWWAGGGYSWDSSASAPGDRGSENEARLQLAWVPSEFSGLRTELGWLDPLERRRELTARVQLNFTIGAHPAHQY